MQNAQEYVQIGFAVSLAGSVTCLGRFGCKCTETAPSTATAPNTAAAVMNGAPEHASEAQERHGHHGDGTVLPADAALGAAPGAQNERPSTLASGAGVTGVFWVLS